MNTASGTYNPNYAIHPGEYLEEILQSRGIGKKEFADRCGLSPKTVSLIVNGKVSFSPDVALQFEKVLNVTADIWLRMLSSWQLYQSRRQEVKYFQELREWAKQFPLSDMKRLGMLEKTDELSLIVRQLLTFFNVSSPKAWEEVYYAKAIACRRSPTLEASSHSIATWLRIAEKSAADLDAQPYSKDRLKIALEKIRKLTNEMPQVFEPRLRAECSESGIVIVFVPELQRTRISGATEWLTPDRALIAMSLRHKTNDHFWFTLFHEIGHIYLHEKKCVFIDVESDEKTESEKEADYFARKILVPIKEYQRFTAESRFYKPDILQFAARISIAAGIVVGMLQHDGLIDYSWHNSLKQKFSLVPQAPQTNNKNSI